MKDLNRSVVLTIIAALSVTALAIHYWRQAGFIQVQEHSIHCRQLECDYQMALHNPGPHQGVRLLWVAHIVDKEEGEVFGFLRKNTKTVIGDEVYMVAGSQREIGGHFRKPERTNYVVLKLEPIND